MRTHAAWQCSPPTETLETHLNLLETQLATTHTETMTDREQGPSQSCRSQWPIALSMLNAAGALHVLGGRSESRAALPTERRGATGVSACLLPKTTAHGCCCGVVRSDFLSCDFWSVPWHCHDLSEVAAMLHLTSRSSLPGLF